MLTTRAIKKLIETALIEDGRKSTPLQVALVWHCHQETGDVDGDIADAIRAAFDTDDEIDD